MNNGWSHDYLVKDLEDLGRLLRASVRRENPIPGGGYGDLVFRTPSCCVLCEVEASSAARAVHDVAKAVRLGASALLIVTPTRRLAHQVRRRLRGQRVPRLPVIVCPHGAARDILTALLGPPPPSPERVPHDVGRGRERHA